MLVRAQKKSRKIQESEKDKDSLSFSPPITKRQFNVSVMGELVYCFCHEIDIETNLCAAGSYYAKRTKNYVKHDQSDE